MTDIDGIVIILSFNLPGWARTVKVGVVLTLLSSFLSPFMIVYFGWLGTFGGVSSPLESPL